jgi:hypothetical protein
MICRTFGPELSARRLRRLSARFGFASLSAISFSCSSLARQRTINRCPWQLGSVLVATLRDDLADG